MIARQAVAHSPKLALALSFAVVMFFGLLAGGPAPEVGPTPQPDTKPTPPAVAPQHIEWLGSQGTLTHVTAETPVASSTNAEVNIRQSHRSALLQVCVRPHDRLRVAGDGWHRQDHGNLTWCTEVREGSDVRFELEWTEN